SRARLLKCKAQVKCATQMTSSQAFERIAARFSALSIIIRFHCFSNDLGHPPMHWHVLCNSSDGANNQLSEAQLTGMNRIAAGLGMAAAMTTGTLAPVVAQDTIKVAVLHSLSGTMAISETTLKDTMLFL